MQLTGTKIHLWFLPFAFVAGWALVALMPFIHRYCTFAMLWTVFTVGQLGLFYALSVYTLPWPFYQWLFVVPSVLLGLILYAAGGDPARLLWICVGASLACLIASTVGWHRGTLQTLIASVVCAVAMISSLPATRLTSLLSQISLGIYLVHPLVHSALIRLLDVVPGTVEFAAGVAALSTLVAIVLRRLPVIRRIV